MSEPAIIEDALSSQHKHYVEGEQQCFNPTPNLQWRRPKNIEEHANKLHDDDDDDDDDSVNVDDDDDEGMVTQ